MTASPVHVLHLMLVDLKPEVDSAQRDRLVAAWVDLASVDGVTGLGTVPESADGTHSLGLFAALNDVTATENFGTDARHMTFLRDHFIPALKGFAGADLFIDTLPPAQYGGALCLLFNTPPGTYDWQVKAAFDALYRESGAVALCAGIAINNRQRYQAGGVLFFDTAFAANGFATGERYERVRARNLDPIATDLALLWGVARPVST